MQKNLQIQQCKRWVIKVGSALVTDNGKGFDFELINQWAKQISKLVENNYEIILVSSGAIVCGFQRLGKTSRPTLLPELQACAAIGQMRLANGYEQIFGKYGLITAQILLTHEDHADRTRYLNTRATLLELLKLKTIPIINENDTVSTDEIKFGDNDTLGALVAHTCAADLLVILTDQNGLYDSDPRKNPAAKLVQNAIAGDPVLETMAGGAASTLSKGGMITKILAAKRAAQSRTHTIIANGKEPDVLLRIADGKNLGTFLSAESNPQNSQNSKKLWILDHLQVAGKLFIDEGAKKALQENKSLLPIGVVRLQGNFVRGELVGIYAESDPEKEIARGLINYNHSQSQRLLKQPSNKIAEILGFIQEPELINRDNLVVF